MTQDENKLFKTYTLSLALIKALRDGFSTYQNS